MSKARRKGKGKGKPERAPAVHKFSGRAKPKPAPAPEDKAPAIHKFSGRKGKDDAPARNAAEPVEKAEKGDKADKGDKAPPKPKGMAARLAAMAAASAEVQDEPEVEVKPRAATPAPKGGVEWKDFEDDDEPATPSKPAHRAEPAAESDPVLVGPKSSSQEVDPGIQVVAKNASKFSAADLELLRASIKVKGTGAIVEGINLDELKWDGEGLLPVVAQDRRTGAVLMLGHVNKETLESSLRGKVMTYWNRTTGKPMARDESSGHPQRLVKLGVDCDKDALWAIVEQDGPACHKDTGTCWTDQRAPPVATFLGELDRIIQDRAKTPQKGSHTTALLGEPIQALRKFVEQANEVTRHLQGKGGKDETIEHAVSDLLYHLLVVLRTKGVGLAEVLTELQAQHMAMEMQKAKQG